MFVWIVLSDVCRMDFLGINVRYRLVVVIVILSQVGCTIRKSSPSSGTTCPFIVYTVLLLAAVSVKPSTCLASLAVFKGALTIYDCYVLGSTIFNTSIYKNLHLQNVHLILWRLAFY